MLDVLDKHKIIGGKGLNTLTYLENTDEDFNVGELNGVASEGGVLKIPTRIDDKCELLIKGDLPCVDLSPRPKEVTAVTTSYVDAEEGNTLTFTSGQYIKLGTEIVIAEEEDFTIEFKIKRISSDVANNKWLISDTTSGSGNGSDIRFKGFSTSGLTLTIKSITLSISNINDYITIGNWHTLAITRFKNKVSIWVDSNELVSSSSPFKDAFTIKTDTHLMNWKTSYTSYFSNCYLKELLITRKALYVGDTTKHNRLSPQIHHPGNVVSAKCDWEGEGKVSTYQRIKKHDIENTVLYLKGEDFTDSSLYNKPVTNVGATINSNGKFNKGIELANTRINIDRGLEGVDLSKDFTIDWWEYSTGATTTKSSVFTTRTATSTTPARAITLGYSGTKLYAGTSSATTTTSWDIFNGVDVKDKVDNVWVHWAFVKKGTKYTTYKNGVEFWSETTSSIPSVEGDNINLGAWIDSSNIFMGYNAIIDNFRISNVARWEADFIPPEKDYELDEELITPLEKGKTINSLPNPIQLIEEVEGEETISNVSLEMKYGLEDTSTVPKEESEENSNVLYLYKSGDPEGKMVRYIYGGTSTNSCAFESDKINTYVPSGAIGLGVRTSEMIDLTPYSTLYVEGQNVTGSTCHFHLSKNGTMIPNAIGLGSITTSSRIILEVDISKYNDTYYIGQYQNGDGGARRNYIYNIWLEK